MRTNTLSAILSLCLTALLLFGCSNAAKIERGLSKAREYKEQKEFLSAEIELKNVLRADVRNEEAIKLAGEIYFLQGRFREAIPYVNTAKMMDPEDAENRYRLAAVMTLAGARELAFPEAQFATQKLPDHPEAALIFAELANTPANLTVAAQTLAELPETAPVLVAKGVLDLRSQRVVAAQAKFDRALEINPEFSAAYSAKATVAGALGQIAVAEANLEKAVAYADPRSGIHVRYAGYLAYNKGDVEAASAHLQAQLEKAPDYLPLLSAEADYLAQLDKVEESKALVDKALNLDPRDPTALRLKGTFFAIEQNYDKAIEAYQRMLEFYPNDPTANYQIALAYIATEQDSEATSHLAIVCEQTPGNLEAASLYSRLQIREGDISGAVITLKQLNEALPQSVEAKLLLAEVFNRQGQYDDALALYQQIENADGKAAQVGFLEGITHLQRNDSARARAAFEHALQTNPGHVPSVQQLTAIDISEGNFESALGRIDRSLEIAPNSSPLYVIRAQVLYLMDQKADAETALHKAVELDGDNINARLQLSRFYTSEGNFEKAIEVSEKTAEISPRNILVLNTLATLYASTNNSEKEIETYERILEVNPQSLLALNNLAYQTSRDEGPSDRALDLAERARTLAPHDPSTADTLGWILYQRGEYTRARLLLVESLGYLADNAEVNYHVGRIDYDLGNVSNGISALQKAATSEESFAEDAQRKLAILSLDPQEASSEKRELVESVLADSPKDTMANVRLAQFERNEGNLDAAIDTLRSVLKTVPANTYAKLELAISLSQKGELEPAMNYVKEVVARYPNNPRANYVQGLIAYDQGNHTWAASLLQTASRQLQNDPEAQLAFAKALVAVGNLSNALDAAQQAARLDTASPATVQAASQIANGIRKLEAKDYSSLAASSNSDALTDQLLEAYQSYVAGDASQAQQQFEAILTQFPDQAQAKLGLARILLKDPQNAQKAYDLASEVRAANPSEMDSRVVQAIARYQEGEYTQAARIFSSAPRNQLSAEELYYYGVSLGKTKRTDEAKTTLQAAIDKDSASPFADKAREELASLDE